MSFARNFAAGQQIARGLIDTYDTARERRDIDEVMNAKPTEGSGYTAGDGKMLQDVANARDADGNLAYQLDARQDGSYGLRVRGADGSYTPVGGPGIQPQQYTEFLGQRRSGAMDPAQLERERMLAVADIRTRRDPIAGLQMRRAAKQDAREDTRFSWEEQAQPMKQRAAELQLSGAERTERQGLRADDVQAIEDAVAKMPREELETYAAQLNTNGSQFPMLYTGVTKDGYQFVTTDPKTGKPSGSTFNLSESQLRQLAAASVLGVAGRGQEALARMEQVDKGMAEHIKAWNDALAKTTTSQNDARHKGNQDSTSWFNAQTSRMNAQTNAQHRRDSAEAARERAGLDRMGSARYFEGDDGQMYASVPTMGKGGLSFQTIPVNPEGIKLKTPGRGLSDKPVKVPEEGEKYMVGDRVMVTDGEGGYVAPGGVVPRVRSQVLARAGVPEGLVDQLPWNADGTAVGFAGKAYSVADPKDMAQLARDLKRLQGNTMAVEEANRTDHHYDNNPKPGLAFGPRLTQLRDGRPEVARPQVGDGLEAWDAYRKYRNATR